MLDRGAGAAFANRAFERNAVDLYVGADPDVVDRHAGVLAEQIVGLFGDVDVLDHRRKNTLRDRRGFLRGEAREALLDVRRQNLERADVKLFRRFLDLPVVDVHVINANA